MSSVRGIVLVARRTTRNIARDLVKNSHFAGPIKSKAQCNRTQPLVFSRFSSCLPSNDGDINDPSGSAVGNTSRDERPEDLDVKVGMSETPPPMAQSFPHHVQQSTSDVQVQEDSPPFLPIPDLPPQVDGYPTPWLNKQDHVEYLTPLYTRGWGVSFKMPRSKEPQPRSNNGARSGLSPKLLTAHLVGLFNFKNYKSAAGFLATVAEIADSENHHPNMLTLKHGKKPSVALVTQTDSAIRPAWTRAETRRLAGITCRDLRLAVLVETLYTDEYEETDMRSVRRGNHRPNWNLLIRRLQASSLDREALAELNRRQPNLKCNACGGQHMTHNCIDRDKYPPPRPCSHCGGRHWARDCPKAPKFQCTICGMNHPTEICPQNKPLTPCPNCGGDHWLADCRTPQLDDEFAHDMMFRLPNDK